MAKSYSERLNNDLVQPQSTRARHRLRGPRESHKINLENDQWICDMVALYSLRAGAEAMVNTIDEDDLGQVGYIELSDCVSVYRDDTLVDDEHPTLQTLASQLQGLNLRVRALET